MSDPIGELSYSGEVDVRPFRRGTYLGADYLEDMVERALGARYSYGSGWRGVADVSIVFRERTPQEAGEGDDAVEARTRR